MLEEESWPEEESCGPADQLETTDESALDLVSFYTWKIGDTTLGDDAMRCQNCIVDKQVCAIGLRQINKE